MKYSVLMMSFTIVCAAHSAAALPSDADLISQAESAAYEHFSLLDSRRPGRARSWMRIGMESAVLCSAGQGADWNAQCLVVSRERNTWTPSWSMGSPVLVTLSSDSQPLVEFPEWEPPLSGGGEAWQDTSAAALDAFNTAEGRRSMAIVTMGRSDLMRRIVAESACADWVEVGKRALLLFDDSAASTFTVTLLLEHPHRSRLRAAATARVAVRFPGEVSLAPVLLFGPQADTLLLRFVPELRPHWGADAGSFGAPVLHVYLEYGMGNILDTYAGTYTKDMVVARDTTVALRLDPDEQALVLRKAEEVGFFTYPLFVQRQPHVRMSPDASPDVLRLRTSTADRAVSWSYPMDRSSPYTDGLLELKELLRRIIEAKKEYQALPAAQGGYF